MSSELIDFLVTLSSRQLHLMRDWVETENIDIPDGALDLLEAHISELKSTEKEGSLL